MHKANPGWKYSKELFWINLPKEHYMARKVLEPLGETRRTIQDEETGETIKQIRVLWQYSKTRLEWVEESCVGSPVFLNGRQSRTSRQSTTSQQSLQKQKTIVVVQSPRRRGQAKKVTSHQNLKAPPAASRAQPSSKVIFKDDAPDFKLFSDDESDDSSDELDDSGDEFDVECDAEEMCCESSDVKEECRTPRGRCAVVSSLGSERATPVTSSHGSGNDAKASISTLQSPNELKTNAKKRGHAKRAAFHQHLKAPPAVSGPQQSSRVIFKDDAPDFKLFPDDESDVSGDESNVEYDDADEICCESSGMEEERRTRRPLCAVASSLGNERATHVVSSHGTGNDGKASISTQRSPNELKTNARKRGHAKMVASHQNLKVPPAASGPQPSSKVIFKDDAPDFKLFSDDESDVSGDESDFESDVSGDESDFESTAEEMCDENDEAKVKCSTARCLCTVASSPGIKRRVTHSGSKMGRKALLSIATQASMPPKPRSASRQAMQPTERPLKKKKKTRGISVTTETNAASGTPVAPSPTNVPMPGIVLIDLCDSDGGDNSDTDDQGSQKHDSPEIVDLLSSDEEEGNNDNDEKDDSEEHSTSSPAMSIPRSNEDDSTTNDEIGQSSTSTRTDVLSSIAVGSNKAEASLDISEAKARAFPSNPKKRKQSPPKKLPAVAEEEKQTKKRSRPRRSNRRRSQRKGKGVRKAGNGNASRSRQSARTVSSSAQKSSSRNPGKFRERDSSIQMETITGPESCTSSEELRTECFTENSSAKELTLPLPKEVKSLLSRKIEIMASAERCASSNSNMECSTGMVNSPEAEQQRHSSKRSRINLPRRTFLGLGDNN